MSQPYKVVNVKGADDFVRWAPFLYEGWQVLCDPTGARCDVSWEAYSKVLLRVACMDETEGAIFIYLSKNDKPLGYTVVIDDTEVGAARTALIYAGYSNGKYAGATRESLSFVETWARKQGFTQLRAQSRRLSGAAMRLFRKRMGFKPHALIFTKDIL